MINYPEMKKTYQNQVLSFLKESDFLFDRGVLFRGIAVGIIPKEGAFSTSEIINGGGTMGTTMFVPLYNDRREVIDKRYPRLDSQNNQALFPLISSDATKITEHEGVVVNLTSPYGNYEDFSSSKIYNENNKQDISQLVSDKRLVKVTADSTLRNELEESSFAIGHLDYFILKLDLDGTEYLSMDYLETKVKYMTFCEIGNFGDSCFPEGWKIGAWFDYSYINREEKIYKPLFNKFIKNNSINLCR
ncbi:MAG: hypothetical protein V1841_01390 [Patescibacteria group bacterium]